MTKILRNEIEKYFRYRWIIYFLSIAFSAIVLNLIRTISDNSNYQYLNLIAQSITSTNLESGLMALVIPIITIVISNSIVAEDYESGTMKFLIISPITRIEVLFGKFLSIVLILLINIITVFILVSIMSGFLAHNYQGIFSQRYLVLLGKYILISISIIPIILGSILIALLLDKFEKSVTLSIVIFFIFYIIDNLFSGIKFFSISYEIINLMFITGTNQLLIYKSLIFSILYSLIIMIINIITIKRKDFWI
ncbi:ABC transporter permease [Clostridium pasteurianum]|uniref:ABC-type transport system involved in multi-copper enzyme maturation, permease component n=1 Tax=Clostridium pasteurianum BC1 TaxID=86416 RepID=R4K4J4_CLOPA|nr:ABC transporter permease subunit [Clostridium pasteurianum]AGK96636.1 hypothetical protein Clopa_1715 [Clostridium pasteurianum BC1]